MYNIRRERRCELIEEGMRMADLKRWRALDQLDYKNFPNEAYRVSGMNLWESEELSDFAEGAFIRDVKVLIVKHFFVYLRKFGYACLHPASFKLQN